MRKKLSLLAIVALAVVPGFASAAVLSTPLTVGSSNPKQGDAVTVSGTCGSSSANDKASFYLTQNNTNTNLDTANNLTTDSNGAFSGSVTIPSNYTVGSAVLTAKCEKSSDTINSASLTISASTTSSGSGTGTSNFTLPATNPTVGGLFNLTGTCTGTGNTTGNVEISLGDTSSSSSTGTSLGTSAVTSTGAFSVSNLIIPSTTSAGTMNLKVTCPDGTSSNQQLTIGSASVTSFNLNGTPALGGAATVTGTCVNITSSGSVKIALWQNGTNTPLSTVTSGTDGAFTSAVSFPTSANSGAANIIVTCPNDATYASAITLAQSTSTTPSPTPTDTTTPPTGGLAMPTDFVAPAPTPTPQVLGTVTPVGGVAAGTPQNNSANYILVALFLVGAYGAARVIRSMQVSE